MLSTNLISEGESFCWIVRYTRIILLTILDVFSHTDCLHGKDNVSTMSTHLMQKSVISYRL